MRHAWMTHPLLWALIFFQTPARASDGYAGHSDTQGESPEGTVIKRIPELSMYPCNDCHATDADYNSTSRELTEEHVDIVLHHGKEENLRWCHSCHQEKRYNKLALQNGREVGFNQSYQLCGSCHGPILDDWEKNIHGKRVGGWRGEQEITACPACHNAHDPPFKALKPEPPPELPWGKHKSLWELIFGKEFDGGKK